MCDCLSVGGDQIVFFVCEVNESRAQGTEDVLDDCDRVG